MNATKRTRRRWDTPRCTETSRNEPADAAKRTGEDRCGRRCVGTCRNGQIDAAKRTGEVCCGLRYAGNGDKQRRTDGNRTRDEQEQRSGRRMDMVGIAARKHTETGLRKQRSGQEKSAVGFADREQKKLADSNNEAHDKLPW